MYCLTSMNDFDELFEEPFEPRKLLYSATLLDVSNEILREGFKQVALDLDEEDDLYNNVHPFPCGANGCRATFVSIHDYDVHYRSMHTFSCRECKKNFTTYNMLDTHILEKHDSYYQAALVTNKAMVSCFVEGCDLKFETEPQRDLHVIGDHSYPSNFMFKSLKSAASKPEDMEVESSAVAAPAKPKWQVPRNLSFGRGMSRTFQRAQKRGKPTKEISMKELEDAL